MMGRGRGSGGPGVPPPGFKPPPENATFDPFAVADDPNKALLHQLLAVPGLRQKYLGYVEDIAATLLDWKKLGLLPTTYQSLLSADVRVDTRKVSPTEAFEKRLTKETSYPTMGPFGSRPHMGLKQFAEERRKFLRNYKEPSKKPGG